MNFMVFESLFPVAMLMGAGFLSGRLGWVRASAIQDLSNLVFLLLTPALLFRTMSRVHVEQLDVKPVAAYFLAAAGLFSATLLLQGFNRRAAVLGLATTFSNTVMMGIVLVSLLYGPAGLVTLFTLISVHSLVLLTLATVLLELAVAREHKPGVAGVLAPPPRHALAIVLLAMKNAIIHPVPLPILAGLLFAQTGLALPPVVDKPLELLANAFGPMALVLVGITLAFTPIGRHWRPALAIAGAKNLLHPLLVFLLCRWVGVEGLPMTVMVVTAALPIGANVFLFSRRYQVAEDLVTASVAVSSALALLTLTWVLMLVG